MVEVSCLSCTKNDCKLTIAELSEMAFELGFQVGYEYTTVERQALLQGIKHGGAQRKADNQKNNELAIAL